MDKSAQSVGRARGRGRYSILAMLFAATTINYADRATLSIAGTQVQAQLGLSAVTMGYLFSAFGWAYVAAQIPGGWLLDRYGSRPGYAVSIVAWSVLALTQGAFGLFTGGAGVAALFFLRLFLSFAESPPSPPHHPLFSSFFPS